MNALLLNRQLGSVSPQALARAQNSQSLKSLELAKGVRFAQRYASGSGPRTPGQVDKPAHAAGVNSIAIDRFEGRYLISGGADSSLAVWDLESPSTVTVRETRYEPLGHVARTSDSSTSSLGITHISFYPFDSLALLTCGYDHTLKLFSSETLVASAKFDLGSIVYSHATSNVAAHLLVACASQHPAVRLVDLRSGANTHSLAGHSGSVLSVAWHPRDENVLASGATDGVVRLWDVRRSASSLGVMDMEDSIGILGYDGKGTGARRRERGRSHNGAVNGLAWTDDGRYLVSNAHDEKLRVWDTANGANTLASFGPNLKNSAPANLFPLLAPSHISPVGRETILHPNPKEILMYDMHSGTPQGRLRVPGAPGADVGARIARNRTTSLAWRAHHVELYSAHADGTLLAWKNEAADHEEELEFHDPKKEERKRKREEFNAFVQDLSRKRITFT